MRSGTAAEETIRVPIGFAARTEAAGVFKRIWLTFPLSNSSRGVLGAHIPHGIYNSVS